MEDLFIPYDCETAKGRTRGEKKQVREARGQRSKGRPGSDNEDRGHKQTAAQWEITAETLNPESASPTISK